jgi:hypothetical protein
MRKFSFLKTYFSPFKPLHLSWYFGKVAVGTPYFYPRRWVKHQFMEGYLTAIPRKICFDIVDLGWKTKWGDTDYRFEWSPVWSFVFFGYQVAVTFVAPELDHYWECWLYYSCNTDKSKPAKDRILQAKKEFPCVWTRYNKDATQTRIDYWNLILKPAKGLTNNQ